MVQITHTGKNAEMLDAILRVAQSRFGLYGADKTSMQEIANDLGMSKGSLYYYFPDKESLYIAVIEKELDQFYMMIRERIGQIDDPVEKISAYVQIRLHHFKTLTNLSRFRVSEWEGMKNRMASTWKNFSRLETEIINGILQEGIDNHVFFAENPEEIAVLFLELLRGLRMATVKKKDMVSFEQDEFDALVAKTNHFVDIFINGLKYKK